MEIKVRAEGGSTIGQGHWSRTSFLLNCAGDKMSKKVFTTRISEFEKAFRDVHIEAVHVANDDDFLAQLESGDIVILDGYDFGPSYIGSVKQRGALIVYIDDLLYSGLEVDVVVNHNPGIKCTDFSKAAPYTSFFLGGDYSMVSPEFRPPDVEDPLRLKRVVVAMGGADPANYTARILRQYKSWLEGFECVDVIVGINYSYFSELTKSLTLETEVNFHQNASRDKVVALMQRAGVAILSASTMAMEYAHIGGVLTIVKTADNQDILYKGLLNSGTAMIPEDIAGSSSLHQVYRDLLAAQRKTFDGLSRKRFRKLFDELFVQRSMVMRKAGPGDSQRTFAWATDSIIRAYSFSQHEITREEHYEWFTKKINSEKCLYLIAETDEGVIGSIRFDIVGNEAIVSYLVDKRFHNRGLGRVLLAEGIKQLLKEKYRLERIYGFVMPDNVASVKIFQRLGFSQVPGGPQYPLSIKFFKNLT